MKAAIAVTLCVCSLIAMFGLNRSLHCYECNVDDAKIDPNCESIDKLSADYLVHCPPHGTKCGTVVVYGRGDDPDHTSRGCFEEDEAERCEEIDSPDISCEVCDTDGCNVNSPMSIG